MGALTLVAVSSFAEAGRNVTGGTVFMAVGGHRHGISVTVFPQTNRTVIRNVFARNTGWGKWFLAPFPPTISP